MSSYSDLDIERQEASIKEGDRISDTNSNEYQFAEAAYDLDIAIFNYCKLATSDRIENCRTKLETLAAELKAMAIESRGTSRVG